MEGGGPCGGFGTSGHPESKGRRLLPGDGGALFGPGDAGDVQGQLQLLAQHRKCLLEKVHREERRIQCLDYLVYQMEKESPKE